jgi:hypothetical protein
MNRYRFLSALLLTLAAGASTAYGDTIRITSGVVAVGPGVAGPAVMAVFGDQGFSFVSTLSPQGRADARACGQSQPCAPGAAIPVGASWSGLDLLGGVATLDGKVYPQVGGATSPNQLAFDITGPGATAPAFGAADFASVTTPFTLTGLFRYGSASGPSTTADLFGAGLATLDLARGTGALADSWVYQGVRYDFGANAVPTPEPSSLLLLATGALLVGAMRWRRRAATRS